MRADQGGSHGTGGNDVHTDFFVLGIEKDDTERFPVGLTLGFDELANMGFCFMGGLLSTQKRHICRNDRPPYECGLE